MTLTTFRHCVIRILKKYLKCNYKTPWCQNIHVDVLDIDIRRTYRIHYLSVCLFVCLFLWYHGYRRPCIPVTSCFWRHRHKFLYNKYAIYCNHWKAKLYTLDWELVILATSEVALYFVTLSLLTCNTFHTLLIYRSAKKNWS